MQQVGGQDKGDATAFYDDPGENADPKGCLSLTRPTATPRHSVFIRSKQLMKLGQGREHADHSFHVSARSGRRDADVLKELLDFRLAWMQRVVG